MEILFAALLGIVATDAPTVANPGFEELSQRTGLPLGWSFTSLPGQANLVRYEARAPRAGQKSQALAITVAGDHPEKEVAYNAHQDVLGIVAGKKYRVSAKVRTQGLRTLPMVVVQCLDETGTKHLLIARSAERALAGDVKDWERVETEVTVPEGTVTFRLRIGVPAAGNAGGTALIDDIQVVEAQ
jgi:hypothetical protein